MMGLYISNILKTLILPPGIILVLLFFGLVLLKHKPVAAKVLLWSSLFFGYLLSTPLVSSLLQQQLQIYPALKEAQIKQSHAQAIVVLSAGRYMNTPEYRRDTVDDTSLVRVRYAAYLHRIIALPIVVSGGYVNKKVGESLAQVMADSLKNDFSINEVWLEDKSQTTAENAIFTKKLLSKKGIDTILLVTHATDMPRAKSIFEKEGLKVIAAPTHFIMLEDNNPFSILPSARALEGSYHALYEMVGYVWYAIRY